MSKLKLTLKAVLFVAGLFAVLAAIGATGSASASEPTNGPTPCATSTTVIIRDMPTRPPVCPTPTPCPTRSVQIDAPIINPGCEPGPCPTAGGGDRLGVRPTCDPTPSCPPQHDAAGLDRHCPCPEPSVRDLAAVRPCPSGTPTSSASTTATGTPSSTLGSATSPSGTTASTSATTAGTGVSSNITTAVASVSPTGPVLAHTGASVLPYTLGALGLLALGAGAIGYSRHARSRRSH